MFSIMFVAGIAMGVHMGPPWWPTFRAEYLETGESELSETKCIRKPTQNATFHLNPLKI
jgi:hypothetical protein